jgi:hypothetical protein
MQYFTKDRFHVLDKGFGTGEIVVSNQDNWWLVSTFKTCEVSADEHETAVRALVESFNACRDALAAMGEGVTTREGAIEARAILRRAVYGRL